MPLSMDCNMCIYRAACCRRACTRVLLLRYKQPHSHTSVPSIPTALYSCIKLNLSFMRNTLSCKFKYEFMHIAFANTFIFIRMCKHNAVRMPCGVRCTSLLDDKMICGDAHCRYLSINEWPHIHDVRYRCQPIYEPIYLRLFGPSAAAHPSCFADRIATFPLERM